MALQGGASRPDDLTEAILTIAESPGPILPDVLPALREIFGFDQAIAYRAVPVDDRAGLDLLVTTGFLRQADLARELEAFLARTPGRFAGYDHVTPEPDQRNDVRVIVERESAQPSPLMQLYPRIGLDTKEQLRVLLCDGGSLLAWVGGFREESFDRQDVERLRRLVPALRQRLALERRLADCEIRAAALDVALEAVGTASFLVDSKLRVLHANGIGKVVLDGETDATRDALARAIDSRGNDGWSVSRVPAAGAGWHLVVRRSNRGDPAPRLAAAVTCWGLTRRQAEVLSHLAVGRPNKTISDLLGCSLGTVELHVTAVLQKAGAENRAELVARFWTEL